MKKILWFAAVFIVLMIPLSVSADYVTYFDVLNDVKLLLGDDPDGAWMMPADDAKAAASALEGFTCGNEGDMAVCKKSHWSGEFQITLYFSESTLSALKCEFTGSSIQDLNYQAGTARVPCADDLINRLKTVGIIPADASQQTGVNLFEETDTSAYKDVFEIGKNSLLQAGYNSKSASRPKFELVFLVTSAGYTPEISLSSENAPADTAALSDGNNSDDETKTGINDFVKEPAKEISAIGLDDFLGTWYPCFVHVPGLDKTENKNYRFMIVDQQLFTITSSTLANNMVAAGLILDEDSLRQRYYIYPDQIVYSIANFQEPVMAAPVFENGKLKWLDNELYLNENGMISAKIGGSILYFCKANDESSMSDPSAYAGSSETGTDIQEKTELKPVTITISPTEAFTGQSIDIYVKAPGAESVTLYRDNNKETSQYGEEIRMSSSFHSVCTMTYYAEASYNGGSEKQTSEKITVTVSERPPALGTVYQYDPAVNLDPTDVLTVDMPTDVHANEAFSVTINPMKGVSQYSINLYDPNWNSIIENEHVSAGTLEINPETAGKYRFTVYATAEQHLYVDFYVSNIGKTGPAKRFVTGYEQGEIIETDGAELTEGEISEGSGGITLTVNGNVIEAGESFVVNVSAPGADAIRLYRSAYGHEDLRKEAEGDSLEYRQSSVSSSKNVVESYYAVASYGGTWSSDASNIETVTYIPASILRISYPEVVHAGDPFRFGIYEVMNTSFYNVRITDSEGKLVRELRLSHGYNDIDPLPAGMYSITVICVGNESHTMTVPLEVSADAETGKNKRKEEEPADTAVNTGSADGENPVFNEDLFLRTWNLETFYTVKEDGSLLAVSPSNDWGPDLGYDSMGITLSDDGTVEQMKLLDSDYSSVPGSWSKGETGIDITLENGDVLHSCFVSDDRMTCLIDKDGILYAKMEFVPVMSNQESAEIVINLTPEQAAALLSYLEGINFQ